MTGSVRTAKRSLQFFRGGSKVNNNIGMSASCEDSRSGEQPQYVVALDNEQNGKFNFARMTY